MDVTPNMKTVSSKRSYSLDVSFKHVFGGMHFRFPVFKHDHPHIIDVNKVADEQLTMGQRIADVVATGMGSWPFIIIQSAILLLWIVLNSVAWFFHWDPYPFIFMNLALSCQAAYAAPIIMMSQNRQATKDRLTAQNDYITDCKGEEEIRHIMEHLDHQDEVILQIVKRLEEQHTEILGHLSRLDPSLAQRLGMDAIKISQELLDESSEIAGNS